MWPDIASPKELWKFTVKWGTEASLEKEILVWDTVHRGQNFGMYFTGLQLNEVPKLPLQPLTSKGLIEDQSSSAAGVGCSWDTTELLQPHYTAKCGQNEILTIVYKVGSKGDTSLIFRQLFCNIRICVSLFWHFTPPHKVITLRVQDFNLCGTIIYCQSCWLTHFEMKQESPMLKTWVEIPLIM